MLVITLLKLPTTMRGIQLLIPQILGLVTWLVLTNGILAEDWYKQRFKMSLYKLGLPFCAPAIVMRNTCPGLSVGFRKWETWTVLPQQPADLPQLMHGREVNVLWWSATDFWKGCLYSIKVAIGDWFKKKTNKTLILDFGEVPYMPKFKYEIVL